MSWFKVDDAFSSSRKLLRMPRSIRLEAAGLWVVAGSWSAGQELDGLVPDYMIDEWGGRGEVVDALVSCGLWERTDDGSQFVNWSEYQPTAAENEERRRAERQRKAEWRKAKKSKNVPHVSQRDTHGTSRDTFGQSFSPAVVQKDRLGTDEGRTWDNRVTDGGVPRVSQRDSVNAQVADGEPQQVPNLSQWDAVVTDPSVPELSGRSPLYPDPTRPDPYKSGGESRNVTTRATRVSPEKPDRCERHQDTAHPPSCGACASRRVDHEREQAAANAETEKANAAARTAEAEARAAERERKAAAIQDCDLCDDHGYHLDRAEVCSHNPDADATARRGLKLARAAITRPEETHDHD